MTTTAAIKSRSQFFSVIDDAVERQMEKELLEIDRDKMLLGIREKFDPDITELAETIKTNLAMAEEYSRDHRAALFAETNSSETSYATFGFRIGAPALALLDPKGTWDKVVLAIKSKLGRKAKQFIRIKEEPDKTAIKTHLDDAGREEIGTVLERKETFFVDPKRDPADPHRLVAAPAP